MVSDEAVRAIAAGVLTTQAGELTGSQIAQAMARELLTARPVVAAVRKQAEGKRVVYLDDDVLSALDAHDAAVGQGEG